MPKLNTLFQLLAVLLVLNPTGQANAHAVVTSTSLEASPVQAYKSTKVKLTFNSNVELALSKIFLVSRGDKQQLLHAGKTHTPGLVVVTLPALEPGEYALKFQVFAADGHLTEDIIRFNVSQ